MVQLRYDCNCGTCPGGETPKGADGEPIYGGWVCMCPCHRRKHGKIKVKLRYAGRGKPLPVDDNEKGGDA